NPSFDHRVVDSVIGMGQLRGSGPVPSSPQQMTPEQRRFVMLMDQADQIMRATGHDVPPHTDGDPASAADMQHETLVDSIRVTLAWQLHLATPSNATTVPPAAVQQVTQLSDRLRVELDNSASGDSRPAPSRATNSFQRAVEWLRTPPLRHLPPVPAPVTPRGTSATTQAPPQTVHNQRMAAGQTQFRPQAGPGWNGSGYAPGWNGNGYAPGRNGNGYAPGWNRNGYAPTTNGPRPTPMPPRAAAPRAAAPRAAAPPALRPVPHNNPGGLSRVDNVRPWVSSWWRTALVALLVARWRRESAANALREAESNLAFVEQANERNGDAPSQVQQQRARLRRAVESARARVRLEQAALQHAEQRVRGIDPLAWQQVQLFADSWQSEAWATFAE